MLRVTKTRRSDETSELHYTEDDSNTALCGADNQGRASAADRSIYLRPFCFSCSEDKQLSEDEEEEGVSGRR